jgi:hypothetical protein
MTSSEDLTETIDLGVTVMAAASAETLQAVAAHDERRLWARDGATSMSAWLAGRYGFAKGTSREWVRVAHALKVLPAIAAAYASGRLSWDQLRPLTRFADPEHDQELARTAPGRSSAALWIEARRHERLSAREAEDAHRRRYLSMWWDPEKPLLYLEGMLAGDQGAAVEAALSRRAEDLSPDPDATSPGEARLADALTELVTASGSGNPQPATLVVHADVAVVTGQEPASGPSRSETELGQRLAVETVRRLACDGRVEWVLESAGRPVGVGRRGRTVPAHVARLLRHRDLGCRFPGCERKRWLHAHHVIHWADGGVTDLDNLILLCGTHHRLIHEGGWRVRGDPARHLRFHDPGGRPLQAAA